MPKKTTPQSPQQIAEDIADRYFAAVASDLPCDVAPGDVNLVEGAVKIAGRITQLDRRLGGDRETRDWDAALRGGYLLGVAVGRRMGGVTR